MIPKRIWQTYKTDYPPRQSIGFAKSWQDYNPDYEWYYFNDEKCQKFIQDHFDDEFYQMYCSLPIGVMKSDVWRVAVVYVYGGVYADLDTQCLAPISEWINNNDRLVVGVETPHGALNNYIFAAEPGHPAVAAVLNTLLELYNSPGYLHKDSPTPVQDFGANAWSHGILRHYGLDNPVAMEQGGAYYNTAEKVKQEGTRFYPYESNAFAPGENGKTFVEHHTASQFWDFGKYQSWRTEQHDLFGIPIAMKPVKFITTFNKNGYHVYGKSWIESFLKFTEGYSFITAKIYVEDMDVSTLDYGPRVELVDFKQSIPAHADWVKLFKEKTEHDDWNRDLAIKFSFKSFVMINSLKNTSGYVIWLDADSVFIDSNFNTFAEQALAGNFVACQKEAGSTHVESGIVIFDADHPDRQKFVDEFEQYYFDPTEFNSFGQFFDGYALRRAIENTEVACFDLNEGYGVGGIQSDPGNTFLNPLIKSRFVHNIGLTGKKQYETWTEYAPIDPMFQLIPGINDKTREERLQETLEKINDRILTLRRR